MESAWRTGARIGVCLLAGAWLALVAFAGRCAAPADQARPDGSGTPTPVQIYVYVGDVSAVVDSEQAFDADVVMIAVWRDPRLTAQGAGPRSLPLEAVWHPRLLLLNRHRVDSLLPDRVEVDASGTVRHVQGWLGRFTAPMDLRSFPVDRQRLEVRFISLGYSSKEVDLIPRTGAGLRYRRETFSVTDWDMGPARMERADFTVAPGAPAFAGLKVAWEGRRRLGYYMAQVFAPLLVILFMGWTPLLLDHSLAGTRITVAATTILTLIAYRFALGTQIPHLPYLTRFDYFMLGSTVLVFLILTAVTLGAAMAATDKAASLRRMDHRLRLVFPAALIVLLLLVVVP